MSVKADIEKFVRNLKRGVGVTASQKNMRLIGERCIQLIVRRTQQGLGVKMVGGAEMPLRALSQNYIAFRNKQRRNLDPTTTANKSNLTFTGQMLRSMTIKQVSNSIVRVGPNEKVRKGGLTNARLAEILQQKRPFNNLSAREIKTVVEFFDEILQLEIVKTE